MQQPVTGQYNSLLIINLHSHDKVCVTRVCVVCLGAKPGRSEAESAPWNLHHEHNATFGKTDLGVH